MVVLILPRFRTTNAFANELVLSRPAAAANSTSSRTRSLVTLVTRASTLRPTVTPTPVSKRILVPSNSAVARAMSQSTKPNASGIPPVESMNLKERSVKSEEQKVVNAIKELYSCKPKNEAYDVYSPNAEFKDPIGLAEGIDSIKAQFNGLAKIFPRADVTKFRILENPAGVPASTILIDQDVAYYRDPNSDNPTKILNSLLTIDTDASSHLVTRHIEEWNHQSHQTSEDGFFGMLNDYRKKLTANVVDMLVSTEPPKPRA